MCLIFDCKYRRKLLKIMAMNVPILGWKVINKPGKYYDSGVDHNFENYSGIYFVREYKLNRELSILGSRLVI